MHAAGWSLTAAKAIRLPWGRTSSWTAGSSIRAAAVLPRASPSHGCHVWTTIIDGNRGCARGLTEGDLVAKTTLRNSTHGVTQLREADEMKQKLVLIGNGMAGVRTFEELLKLAPDSYEITVFGAEPHPNYNRIMLSPVLAGERRSTTSF